MPDKRFTITSYDRGHKIYCDDTNTWRYVDTGEVVDHKRRCKRCDRKPIPEGYDACMGYIEGAVSVCCGHGVTKPIMVMADEKGTVRR